MKPSRLYELGVEEARAHHLTSKTYSGKLVRPHVKFIKKLIDEYDCKTMLDYGAGKGKQYEWLVDGKTPMEEYLGVNVTKYDPAWPPYEKDPEGKFDITICTNTLGRIPFVDMDWVVDRIYALTNKVLYVAVGYGGRLKKRLHRKSQHIMPNNNWPVEKWASALTRLNSTVETYLFVRLKEDNMRNGKVLLKLNGWEHVPSSSFFENLDLSDEAS